MSVWRDAVFLAAYLFGAVVLGSHARTLYELVSEHGRVYGLGIIPWWGYAIAAIACRACHTR